MLISLSDCKGSHFSTAIQIYSCFCLAAANNPLTMVAYRDRRWFNMCFCR